MDLVSGIRKNFFPDPRSRGQKRPRIRTRNICCRTMSFTSNLKRSDSDPDSNGLEDPNENPDPDSGRLKLSFRKRKNLWNLMFGRVLYWAGGFSWGLNNLCRGLRDINTRSVGRTFKYQVIYNGTYTVHLELLCRNHGTVPYLTGSYCQK